MGKRKRHHFIPQSYLAGFTDSGKKDGKIYIIDKSTGKVSPTTPINCAVQCNMYTVTMQDETQSDFMEDELSKHEASCSRAVSDVVASRQLPIGETRDRVLDFISLTALRSPAAFEEHTSLLNSIAYKWLRQRLPDAESITSALTKSRGTPPTAEEVQQMKECIDMQGVKIKLGNSTQVQQMCRVLLQIRPSFDWRWWNLLTTPEGGPDFICCDNPVVLVPPPDAPRNFMPGFSTPKTVLLVPLSSRVAMIGSFEGTHVLCGQLDAVDVAAVNSYVLRNARQFIYSRLSKFVYSPDGESVSESVGLAEGQLA